LLGGKKVHPRRQNPGYAYVHDRVHFPQQVYTPPNYKQ